MRTVLFKNIFFSPRRVTKKTRTHGHEATVEMTLFACLASLSVAAVPKDLVTSLPGFPSDWPFKAYSGFLNVEFADPTAVGGYDAAVIHYQFHTARNSNASDTSFPVVAWHTGGPGGSSIYGQYAGIACLHSCASAII